ncbi:MAG: RNA polymerase sigma factor [Vicinamibacterales bacterium]
MAPIERERLGRLRERDPAAIREVIDRHGRRIYRAARGLGFPSSDAEDLVQEVFLTFLETLDRFQGRSAVGTWLFGILHHKAQERRRAHAREEPAGDVEEAFLKRFDSNGSWLRPPIATERLVESRQTQAMLRDCLDTLSAHQRDVFHLREVEELPAGDVARIVGCTANHVGVLLHRARLKLRACLNGKGLGRSR